MDVRPLPLIVLLLCCIAAPVKSKTNQSVVTQRFVFNIAHNYGDLEVCTSPVYIKEQNKMLRSACSEIAA